MTEFTGNDLRNWRKLMKLSRPQASPVMGYGVRHIVEMEEGRRAIRACIPLACAAYALGIRAYSGPQVEAMSPTGKKKK